MGESLAYVLQPVGEFLGRYLLVLDLERPLDEHAVGLFGLSAVDFLGAFASQ